MAERASGESGAEHGQMVDRLHRGVGVIDGRRQGLARDIDQAAQAEPRVLFEGALETDPHGAVHVCRQRCRRAIGITGRCTPHPCQRCSGHEVFADDGPDPDVDPVLGGNPEKSRRVDGLDIAGPRRRDDPRPATPGTPGVGGPPGPGRASITGRVSRSTIRMMVST